MGSRGSTTHRELHPLGHSIGIALLLSIVAGFVDAFGYLALFHIYTANMSGNSVGLMVSLANRSWLHAFEHGWPILGFVVGLCIGSGIVQLGRKRHVKWATSVCIALEIVFLVALVVVGIVRPLPSSLGRGDIGPFALRIALATLAMGLQNVTLRKAGGVSIFTTHVTGTLTKMVEDGTQLLFWFRRRLRRYPFRLGGILRSTLRQPALTGASEMLCLWLMYLAGGISAVLIRRRIGYFALCFPVAALLLAVTHNLMRSVHPEYSSSR